MFGAIIGDIVGSVYEFDNIKTKDFEFFDKRCFFTDDTVMSVAVADALMQYEKIDDVEDFKKTLVKKMHKYGALYPYAGYGGRFLTWLIREDTNPYNSFGNGSAMRVAPVAWYAKSLDEAIALARATAEVTHNHPEGIKGAEVTAGAAFLAKAGSDKQQIREFIEKYYKIDCTIDEIRPTYRFNETCMDTVPQALVAFLESESFEDAIRTGISVGGDSDTLCAICGAVAEPYFGIDPIHEIMAISYLDDTLYGIVTKFKDKYVIK